MDSIGYSTQATTSASTTTTTTITTKKMNGWQVFVGERVDEKRESGLVFGEASKSLSEEWRALNTEERQVYNVVGKNGVIVDLKCERCQKSFKNTAKKNEHVKSCGRAGSCRCMACGKVYRNMKNMREHYYAKHTEMFKCAQCGKCFGGQSKLDRHRVKHDKSLSVACDMCGKKFTWVDSLNKHKNIHE